MDQFVLRSEVLAGKNAFWHALDGERERWDRRHPRFKVQTHELTSGRAVVDIRRALDHLAQRDPAPAELTRALDEFLKSVRIRHAKNEPLRERGLRRILDLMGPRDWQEFADLYPALNEWGLRISLLLRTFYPDEDLFEASYPVGAFDFFDERRARHPAGAFIAGCLLWGRRLVGAGSVDRARVSRWIRPHVQRAVLLAWDPRGPSPAEVELRAELTALQKLITDALWRGDVLDNASFLAAVRVAKDTGRSARTMVASGHARYVAVPLETDLRAVSTLARAERERRLRRRIEQLHADGLTANAIAERLGRDPQTVRRKLGR